MRSRRRAATWAGTGSGTCGRSPRSRTARDQPAHRRQNEVASYQAPAGRLGPQGPPNRCARSMNGHIVAPFRRRPGLLSLTEPGTSTPRPGWGGAPLDHVRHYLDQAAAEGRFGVVAIVVAQEFQWVTGARDRSPKPGVVSYDFVKEERRVNAYYFYVHDRQFGAGFIKICSYFPYPAKVWLNGHEWAKRQTGQEGLSYTALANGFAACPEPARLQAICDRFGPSGAQAFFNRWTAVIPVPFTATDRAAGYWWQLSMRQVEVSRTLVFDDPRRARSFFESLVSDNVGAGRPEQIAAVFAAQVRTRGPRRTKGPFRTRVFSPGTDVKIDFSFKHSRVKQYLKEGRALRIETVINKPAKAHTFGPTCARWRLKLTGRRGGCPGPGRPHTGGCRPGPCRVLRRRAWDRGWLQDRQGGWRAESGT